MAVFQSKDPLKLPLLGLCLLCDTPPVVVFFTLNFIQNCLLVFSQWHLKL